MIKDYYEEILREAIKAGYDNPFNIAKTATIRMQSRRSKEEILLENIEDIIAQVKNVTIIDLVTPFGTYPILVGNKDRKQLLEIENGLQSDYSFGTIRERGKRCIKT